MTITFHWSCAMIPIIREDGSGVDTPEVIAFQYCIIDNSTILRLDTGEQLDIIYTKDSTLVVTVNGSHNVIAVPKLYNEIVCNMDDLSDNTAAPVSTYMFYIYAAVWQALVLSITGYNITVHLLYKKLRNPMGKLLMLYSISFAINSASFFIILTIIHTFPVTSNLNYMCYIAKLVFVESDIGYEAVASCILVHCAYQMRQSYNMIPTNPRENKVLWRRYLCYIIGTIALSVIMITTYDVGTTEGRYNEYCNKHDLIHYTMVTLMHVFYYINAPIQIAMFLVYLYYWYKLRNSRDLTNYQIHQKIFRIAVAMGATIGIANVFLILDWISESVTGNNLLVSIKIVSAVIMLIQHFIIVVSLRCVKNACSSFCKKQPTSSE